MSLENKKQVMHRYCSMPGHLCSSALITEREPEVYLSLKNLYL